MSKFIFTIYNRKTYGRIFLFRSWNIYMADVVGIFRPGCKKHALHSCVSYLFYLIVVNVTCLSLTTGTATAATYYLDAINGDDTDLGTSDAPWKTLDKAISTVVSGDTVYLRDGDYGAFDAYNEDTYTDWITYKADTGHSPVISYDSGLGCAMKMGKTPGSFDKYFHFEGLTIEVNEPNQSAIKLYNSHYYRFIDCTMEGVGFENKKAPLSYPASGIYAQLSSNIHISGCTIFGTGDAPHYSEVTEKAYGPGFDFGMYIRECTDVNIYNCEIKDCGTAVEAYMGDNWHVWDCNMHDCLADLLWLNGLSNSIIEDNHLHHTIRPDGSGPHNDCLQISTPYESVIPTGLTIRRNKMHHSSVQIVMINFIGDGHAENIIFENNLMYAPDLAGTGAWGLMAYKVNNLQFVNNTGPTGIWFRVGIEITKMCNNIFYKVDLEGASAEGEDYNIINRWWIHVPPEYEQGTNTVELNNNELFESLFTDYDNDDFTLAAGSVAINFGDSDHAPATDILGNTRVGLPDAGCYEYVESDPNNSTPVLDSIGNKTVNENALLSFTVNATDADGDTIAYSSQNLPTGATLLGQDFNWTPSYTQSGSYQVTFIASDGIAQDSEIITITVSNTNRPPVLAEIGDKSVNENSLLSFSVTATDADTDAIAYSVQNLPSGAAFTTQTFTWTPAYTQAGTHQVTFIASDEQDQDSETITITVNNVNRAPVLSPIGNKSVYADETLTFTVDATDLDGDTLQYSAQGLPSGATLTNQTFSWTPADSQSGSHEVIFIVSDGQAQDSETIAILVNLDDLAPTVSSTSPSDGVIQVPLNNLITLHIVDSGKGVDANSVNIKVNSDVVYTGNTADYNSTSGHCYRIGTKADYTFIYQASELFDFDQSVSVTVNATDLADNAMAELSYSFHTEMRSFAKNKKVSSVSDNITEGRPATLRDGSGNIWVAWHAGPIGSRDIYLGKLNASADNFDSSIQLTNGFGDKFNAAIAIDADSKLYVAWQDNRNGDWDIYISTSSDGINFSTERLVTDSNDNQTNPEIAVNGSLPANAYIVWQDDRGGNQDIYIASSSTDFETKVLSQITSDSSDQTEPAIAVDSGNTVYVVWTDARNRSLDIYGAASNNGPWTNVAVVSKDDKQKSPAVAAEATGSILHLIWIDDTTGDDEIFYAKTTGGLPSSPLTGSSIVDDTTGADQLEPAIAVSGTTGNTLRVFACWQDERNLDSDNRDTDIYFTEINLSAGTNIFVGDDSTNASQIEPAISIDGHGHPYLVWVDDRNLINNIYYAASTFMNPTALVSENVSASVGATVGTDPVAINNLNNVSVIVPPAACLCDTTITISKVENPQAFAMQSLSSFDFGPSGIQFTQPVTVTIPYAASTDSGSALPYWYNSLTGALSQQGITDVQNILISSNLNALSFKTTHFTQFYLLLGGAAAAAGGGGGGGGCSFSEPGKATFGDFLLPYLVLAVVMIIIKIKDKRRTNTIASNIQKNE
ncbi:MAG: right-handed parallel beta-helix repeat-containing protein [Planctomycetota bacterium]|nr:MAG: right-handed parallel beta-helix repeat-containing protein [Planctomycetota bacterium]